MISARTLILSAALATAFALPTVAGAEDQAASPMEHKMKPSIQEADTNKDGAIDLQEFLARHEAKFKEIDKNADGKLTPDEFHAYGEIMREKMKERRGQMMEHKDGMQESPARETNGE